MASFAELADQIHLWAYIKVAYLFFIFLYILFAVIVVRQINLMTKTFNGSLGLHLKGLGYLHLLIAIGVFIVALVVL